MTLHGGNAESVLANSASDPPQDANDFQKTPKPGFKAPDWDLPPLLRQESAVFLWFSLRDLGVYENPQMVGSLL